LHPITLLVLFAVCLRLASDAVRIADLVHTYQAMGRDLDAGWYWSRAIAQYEREIAQTLVYLVDAAMVEVLARVWRGLRDRRLEGARQPT